jgi:transcriptional regulator with XRE-family HTH domain
MNNLEKFLGDALLPGEVSAGIARRAATRRKELGLSQAALAEKSGVSLGSLKRFERLHQISLSSLVKLAFALDCEQDFEALFSRRRYASIEDVIAAGKNAGKGGRETMAGERP